MNLKNIQHIENATSDSRKELFRLGTALLFIIGTMLYVSTIHQIDSTRDMLLIIAAMIGGYMALNIGANDVANNVGPAVGSKAITLVGAIIIAVIFESAGALIAGGDVVSTIKKGIIDPDLIPDSDTFIWLMMGALLAAAIWLNIATAVGAPVSTTHSIVGGVLGAGIAAGGLEIANWGQMGKIAASWIISPMLGGIIAAGFLLFLKKTVLYQDNIIDSGKKIVPFLIGIMAWAFTTYLLLKGLKKIWKLDFLTAGGIGLIAAVIVFILVRPLIIHAAKKLDNSVESVNQLFTIPLIVAAAFLSFAHGANDVANAVGPLAAINDAIVHHDIATKAVIPLWVMMVGALGIALGLSLYGPKLIKTVGSEITELNKIRSFCVAMAAAITVIIASQLGLPVSSTHIAVGAIFGVGFLREYLKRDELSIESEIMEHHINKDPEEVAEILEHFAKTTIEGKRYMLKELKANSKKGALTKTERKQLNQIYKKQLVKRSQLLRILAAWVITVPASAIMAALLFFMIKGMMIP